MFICSREFSPPRQTLFDCRCYMNAHNAVFTAAIGGYVFVSVCRLVGLSLSVCLSYQKYSKGSAQNCEVIELWTKSTNLILDMSRILNQTQEFVLLFNNAQRCLACMQRNYPLWNMPLLFCLSQYRPKVVSSENQVSIGLCLHTLYYTMIFPYLHYCNIVWASTYPSRLEKNICTAKKNYKDNICM